jgi:hypothetical protein
VGSETNQGPEHEQAKLAADIIQAVLTFKRDLGLAGAAPAKLGLATETINGPLPAAIRRFHRTIEIKTSTTLSWQRGAPKRLTRLGGEELYIAIARVKRSRRVPDRAPSVGPAESSGKGDSYRSQPKRCVAGLSERRRRTRGAVICQPALRLAERT